MRIIFFLPLLIVVHCSFGQNIGSGFGFPTTNNSFLGKPKSGANIGVDLYTGRAQVSVPICNLASKQLNIPITAEYVDGKGVKVQEYASQIGLGWQINAGGSISRVVRGFPDEQTNGYLGTGSTPSGVLTGGQTWGKVVSSYIGMGTAPTQSQLNCLNGVGLSPWGIPTADGQPDIFFVKTPFFSFQFVFDANGKPVFSNSNGYQVISTGFVYTNAFTNSSFEVIDPSGNQYYFGNTSNSTEQVTDSIYGLVPTFITSWYLTKIVSFNSQDAVTFTYQAAPSNDVTYSYSWSELQTYLNQTQTSLSTGKSTITQPKFISAIVSSLGEIDFSYVYNSRRDDPNLPYLSTIVSKAYNPSTQTNSTVLQTYNFNYTYFGLPSTDPNVLRLELSGINVVGNTPATSGPLNLATFGYYTVNDLPNRTWPTTDYWGYCNSVTNPSGHDLYSLFPLNPVTAMAKCDILNLVTTTEGAAWNISYESNSYATTLVGGLRVNSLSETLPTGESLSKSYSYTDASNNASGQVYTTYFNQNFYKFSTSQFVNLYLSSSPYLTQDINGNFIGYSWVKETDQNGGFTYYNFSNFTDGADIDNIANNDFNTTNVNWQGTSTFSNVVLNSEDLSYKRGLLLSKSSFLAGANPVTGYPLTQTTYYYLPQSTSLPVTYSAYGYQSFLLYGMLNNYGGKSVADYSFSTPIENIRLTKVVQTDYDQVVPANSVSTTTNYSYDPLNYRLVNTITTTDSRGVLMRTQNIFHSEDITSNIKGTANPIPLISGTTESNAVDSMVVHNNLDAVIHVIDTRNGTSSLVHNTYSASVYGQPNNIYLSNSATYINDPANTANTLASQQFFNFDASSSNLISSNAIGGKSTAVMYGYNLSYPVADVENATSIVSYTIQSTGASSTINIPPNTYGGQPIGFTNYAAGTITVAMPSGSYLSPPATCFFSFILTGPSNGSGNLCNSSVSGYTCSAPKTVSFANMLAGNYVLTVSPQTNTATSVVPVSVSYTGSQVVLTSFTEYFYEGFEQIGNVSTSAHTGNLSYNGSYTVPFTIPNTRAYLIQWWNYTGGVWNFNQQPYTNQMALSGQIDDIRVFPKDGLMTTYTYNPMVGKTSETDPSGRSIFYQYDGLNRLLSVRDQNNNILKQYDYEYQACATNVYNTAQTGYFMKNNCGTGSAIIAYTVPAAKYGACTLAAANQLAVSDVAYNGQANANNANTSQCISGGITITLANTTSYSNSAGSIYVLIDGLKYFFPNGGSAAVPTVIVPPGNHTVSFSCGPSFYYSINPGTNFYCASTQPPISWNFTGNTTLTVYQ